MFELFLKFRLLLHDHFVTLARNELFTTRAPARAPRPALLKVFEPLEQCFILTLQTIHGRPAEVLPLLRRVVSKAKHAGTGWDVSTRANLSPQIEQCLLKLFDLLKVFLYLGLGLLEFYTWLSEQL